VTTAPRAFVLGGGVAGLVAAFGLADAGHRVVLLESRRQVGGRAFSSNDPVTGLRLDNGPHVMLGCYREMRNLLRRLGTEAGFQQERRLRLAYCREGGTVVHLALGGLPVPLAMPWALMRLRIPFGARVRALLGMGTVLWPVPARWTLADWLRRRWQRGAPDAFLWRPLCRAIMNVEPEQAAARDFLATLREAFLGGAARAAFWLPARGWGELIGDPAPAALAAAGVTLRCGARIERLARSGDRIVGIELGDGERIVVEPEDLVVSALPWFAAARLLPELTEVAAALGDSPIVSAYVLTSPQLPPLPDDGPVVAFVDGDPFHFVIRTPGGDPRRLGLLSGGGRSFDCQAVERIAARALEQLRRYYPGGPWADAVVRVRKEQLATFVAAPGTAEQRPRPGRLPGGPANLRLCGDWTATGFPATLEGAARSAVAMLREFGAAKVPVPRREQAPRSPVPLARRADRRR
jgi:hydroxysqualene dehydroxylase